MSVCRGLHHVAMAVQDRAVYERTVAFYREVLGLSLVRQWTNPPRHITMLDFGNCILEIIFGAEGAGTGVFPHMALAVNHPEDVDRLLERCLVHGCTLERPAGNVEAVEDDADAPAGAFRLRVGFCIGLAGERLEFFYEY